MLISNIVIYAIIKYTLLALVGFCLAFIIYISYKVIKPIRLSYHDIWEYDKSLNSLNEDIRNIDYAIFQLKNNRKLKLNARLFKAKVSTNKYIFLNHGNTCVYTGMLKYISTLIDLGYNVFAPDHSGRGESEGKINTYGYYEHKDSLRWLEFLYEMDKDAVVGVMGESMGGIISLLMAAHDNRLKFVIEDCGFYNAYESVKYVLSARIGGLASMLMPIIGFVYKIIGVNLKSVDARVAVKNIKVPVLIIHGIEDSKVSVENAHIIHDANTNNQLEIFNAEHAQCYGSDKDRYTNIIKTFIERGFEEDEISKSIIQ